jgi:diacylglycerol kinase family enzyme
VVQRANSAQAGPNWFTKSGLSYVYHSAVAWNTYVPFAVNVAVDGKSIYNGKILLGSILNGRFNGGGLNWNREAKIDDALFHLTLVPPKNIFALLPHMKRLKTGDWNEANGMVVAAGRSIEVSVNSGDLPKHPIFEIDGDQPEPLETCAVRFDMIAGGILIWR